MWRSTARRPSKSSSSRLLLAAAVLAVTAWSCTSSSRAAQHHVTTTTTGRASGLAVSVNDSFATTDRESVYVSLWGNNLAWAGGNDFDTLWLRDLATKTNRVLVKAPRPGPILDWVQGSGGSVVYTELTNQLTDATPSAGWTITLLDLATSKKTTVARSTTANDRANPPLPHIDAPWVVWAQGTSANSADVLAFDIRSGRIRVVAHGVTPTTVGVTNGYAVYDTDSTGGHGVYAAPLSGGSPTALSGSGLAGVSTAKNGWVVWQEGQTPSQQTLWVRPVDGSAPAIRLSSATQGNAVPGRTFVAYFGGSAGIYVTSLRDPTQSTAVVTRGRSVPVRLDADGDRLAWGTDAVDAAGNVQTMLFVGTVAIR